MDKYDLPKFMTDEEAYGPAMKMTRPKEVREYFRALVIRSIRYQNKSEQEAEILVRQNLGYHAGYFDSETRARVEDLFECAHPFFGKISENGPPTQEEALEMGIKLGLKLRGNNGNS